MNAPAGEPSNNRGKNQKPGLAARSQAAALLYSVIEQGQSLEGAFDSAGNGQALSPSDRAMTQALVLTALRHLPTLNQAIDASSQRPLKKKAAKVRAILQVLAVQVLILDMAEHAAVSLAVDDAAKDKATRPFKAMVNAVGRGMIRNKAELLAGRPDTDLPTWLSKRWTKAYGRNTVSQMGQALREQPAIDLSLKHSLDQSALVASLADHTPIAIDETTIRLTKPGAISRLPGFDEGQWWVQDYAASLPVKGLLNLLGEPAGKRVLDLCAAPGGKAAQIAAAGCETIAVDQSKARMTRLRDNLKRIGLSADTVITDAMLYKNETLFDAVLLDAPCSATGTLRRNPDVGYLRSYHDIAALTGLQRDLLKHASTLVKPGGFLAYATCSLEPEEGEHQLAAFLTDNPGWSAFIPTAFQPLLDRMGSGKGLRTLPHFSPPAGEGLSGMDGFFMGWVQRHT